MFGEEGDKAKLGRETRLGEARDSLEDITKKKGLAVRVTEERKETKFCESRGEGGGKVGEDNTGGGRGRSEGARVWTQSATSVTEEVCVASPSDVYRKVGTQPAWRWGPVGSRLPSPGAKRWGGPTSTTRHRPRSGSLKTRPIRSVPSRVGEGRVAKGSGVGGGGRSDAAK